jgi:hypothetical protein
MQEFSAQSEKFFGTQSDRADLNPSQNSLANKINPDREHFYHYVN